MKMKGKLNRWNDDRSFGFIGLPNIKTDVFIHISELKAMSRRPLINDVIFFDLITDEKGKNKAVNASIEGVSTKSVRREARKLKKNNLFSNIIFLLLIIGCGFVAYKTYPKWSQNIVESLPVNFVNEDFSGFRCEGKQYCSQMTSCKEARFYLKNCPSAKIDGNNDGVPCES